MLKIEHYIHHVGDRPAIMAEIQRLSEEYPDSALDTMKGPAWSSPKIIVDTYGSYRLCKFVRDVMGLTIVEAWANVLQHGGSIGEHNHESKNRITIAGVYYLTGGEIYIENIGSLNLKAGQIVVFPGNLNHFVPKYIGHNPRVTVAFNAV